MSTSDIKKRAKKTAIVYFCVSVFCAVFGLIYEYFSHGVYSFFMAFNFLAPLVHGALPFFIISLIGKGMPGRIAFNLYNSGVATLTVGFIFKGVLEIYGTTNKLARVYFITFGVLTAVSVVLWIINLINNKKRVEKSQSV